VQLSGDISKRKTINKREVQEKQIVSITLGVRGLMVGSDADLRSHGLTKRDAGTSTKKNFHIERDVTLEMKSSELPLSPLNSFTILSVIIGSAIFMLLAASVVFFLTQRHKKTMQVISVTPQLLNK
jgi:hypothetical protein